MLCPFPVFLSQTARIAAPYASSNPQTFISLSGQEEAPAVSGVRSEVGRKGIALFPPSGDACLLGLPV